MTDNADAPGADVGNQIHGVTGTARLHAGTCQPTLIVKIFVLDPDTVDPERTRPDGREYWKWEWHVYRFQMATAPTDLFAPPAAWVAANSTTPRPRWPGSHWKT